LEGGGLDEQERMYVEVVSVKFKVSKQNFQGEPEEHVESRCLQQEY
jgi:hypothetical protein